MLWLLVSLQHCFVLGTKFKINASFHGFRTNLYKRKGCPSSSCEGVEILKSLHVRISVMNSCLNPTVLPNFKGGIQR